MKSLIKTFVLKGFIFVSLVSLVLTSITQYPSQARACSIGYTPTFEEEYLTASSIFSATVSKVESIYFGGASKQVTIRTHRLFKGTGSTTVLTAMESDMRRRF